MTIRRNGTWRRLSAALVMWSGLNLVAAHAQVAPIRLEIMPTETPAFSAGNGSVTVPAALLVQALKRANYQVSAPASAAAGTLGGLTPLAPPVETPKNAGPSKKLGVRASVVTQSHTSTRGGKLTAFGKETATTSFQTTEYTVLLEVIALEDGQVVCVGEGKATFVGSPTAGSMGLDTAPPVPITPITSPGAVPVGTPTPLPATPGAVGTPPPVPTTPTTPGTVLPAVGVSPIQSPLPMGSLGTVDTGPGQAALGLALQNAVAHLPRTLMARQTQNSVAFRILDIDGSSVVLHTGGVGKLQEGDSVTIQRTRRKIQDTETGQEIAVGFRPIATLKITHVEADYCEATLLTGAPLQRALPEEAERFLVTHKETSEAPVGSVEKNMLSVPVVAPPALKKAPLLPPTPQKQLVSGKAAKHH